MSRAESCFIRVFTHGGDFFDIPLPSAISGACQPDCSSQNIPLLTQAVYLSGLFETPPLCSGLGRCGRCRMRFLPQSSMIPEASEQDLQILGHEATEQDWRLGCRHEAAPGMVIELPENIRPLRAEPGALHSAGLAELAEQTETAGLASFDELAGLTGLSEPVGTPDSSGASGGHGAQPALAVDFGSTSVQYSLVNLQADAGAACSASGSMVNPQMGAGSDIMSRLAFAAGEPGRERLRAVSLHALQRIFNDAGNTGVEMVVAANPAMAYLILGRDAAGLRAAPYHLDYFGGVGESLPGLPPLWLCPLISPFVGGDISAGYAFLAYGQGEGGGATPTESLYPFLLADLGTNGEFLLALDENRALAASLPLGPALEGMGMNCGAEARSGSNHAITSFALGPRGPQPDGLPPGAAPSGISATGYLSLLRNLLKLGLLDEDGLFVTDASGLPPLSRKAAEGFRVHNGETAWFIDDSLYVSATDVEELLKVKASFRLALDALLAEAGLAHGGLRRIYLAGNLGLHVDTGDLSALGFVPEPLRWRIAPVGNSSLAGAELLAARKDLREPLCRWAAGVRTLDLTAAPGFHTLFASAMNFR